MSVHSHWQKRSALLVVLLAASFVGGYFAFASHSSEGARDGISSDGVSASQDDLASFADESPNNGEVQKDASTEYTSKSLYMVRHPRPYDPKSEDKDFCDAIWRGIEERHLKGTGFCGVPVPQGDSDFAFMKWMPLDPEEHIDIVEEMFLWGSVRKYNAYPYRNLSIAEWSKIRSMKEMPQDLRDRFLLPVREELHARLSEIDLYYSEYDFDMDGEKEVIYHMTPVYRRLVGYAFDNSSGTSKPTARVLGPLIIDPPSPCENIGLPGQKKAYLHYVKPESGKTSELIRLSGLMSGNNAIYGEFFLWRERLATVFTRGRDYGRGAAIPNSSERLFDTLCSVYPIQPKN